MSNWNIVRAYYYYGKAKSVMPAEQFWVNSDCGLKTRQWDETKKALTAMVEATKELRSLIREKVH